MYFELNSRFRHFQGLQFLHALQLIFSYDNYFQPTDNNPLTNSQDRQRAPKQQISRCLENGTRIELSLSEISDEEVDYGSYESNANSVIAPDSSWSPL